MSQENESLVREAYQAYSQGDTARLLELVHPGLEWTYLDPADADRSRTPATAGTSSRGR